MTMTATVTRKPLIVIAAGGTGGHVFPGLAVAEQLRKMSVGVIWFGSDNGMEREYVTRENYPFECLTISGVRRTGLLNWWLFPWRLTFALWQAMRLLRKHRPNLILGMGGFVSGPVGLVAYSLDIPLVIHEQNAVAGLTNRCLALLSQRVLLGFPGALKRRAEWIGNPVRIEAVNASNASKDDANKGDEPAQRQDDAFHLLIVGGSRGAQFLNEIVPAAVGDLEATVEVWHQTGHNKGSGVSDEYKRRGAHARVDEFIDDMPAALSWADLVICRSGAQTLAELAAFGVASLLIPFPYAVDDHQTANAEYFARDGAAVLLPQDKLSASALATSVSELLSRERLADMASCARKLARPQAGEQVAAICLEEMAA